MEIHSFVLIHVSSNLTGALARNTQGIRCWNFNIPESPYCFGSPWYTCRHFYKFWQGTSFNILWICFFMKPRNHLFTLNFMSCFLFFETLTHAHFRSLLWVGPALLFSTATAISILGWDGKVRPILSISMPYAGNCFCYILGCHNFLSIHCFIGVFFSTTVLYFGPTDLFIWISFCSLSRCFEWSIVAR